MSERFIWSSQGRRWKRFVALGWLDLGFGFAIRLRLDFSLGFGLLIMVAKENPNINMTFFFIITTIMPGGQKGKEAATADKARVKAINSMTAIGAARSVVGMMMHPDDIMVQGLTDFLEDSDSEMEVVTEVLSPALDKSAEFVDIVNSTVNKLECHISNRLQENCNLGS
ncbi:hypothetical protein PILCRDRAFT_89894 [Piloderma croceum F 1598]|uniref:Uncharacterized protein n=1 Tax=Piloderma croceum (strain F 1598) TaxID=765440 RepID=A0A0C3F4Y9_PILCF|nr:hypothetical protein PILCRDRAFT_89894 [Piloderma croceum F 1598]